MRLLTRSEIRDLVPMPVAIDLMKIAFTELSAGRAVAPVRSVMEINADPSALLMMPAYVPSESALGFKVVSFFGANPAQGLPPIHALVCLVDDRTGQSLALLEGSFVTALRTGAVSGAATDLLARPDSRTLAVIGAGVQGVTQSAAVCAVRRIDRIIVFDINPDAPARFIEAISRDWPELESLVEFAASADAAVSQADIVCTATVSRSAVFTDGVVRPGTHINAVGAFTSEMQEIPVATVGRARIVVDNRAAALAEAGDLLMAITAGAISESALDLELGHIAAGEAPGRTAPDQITFFKSVGNAVQDVVVARAAYDSAVARHIGTEIDLNR